MASSVVQGSSRRKHGRQGGWFHWWILTHSCLLWGLRGHHPRLVVPGGHQSCQEEGSDKCGSGADLWDTRKVLGVAQRRDMSKQTWTTGRQQKEWSLLLSFQWKQNASIGNRTNSITENRTHDQAGQNPHSSVSFLIAMCHKARQSVRHPTVTDSSGGTELIELAPSFIPGLCLVAESPFVDQ